MSKNILDNFILIFSSSLLLFSCSQKNNNIDLSNLPIIKLKAVDTKKESVDVINSKNDEYIKDLVPYKNREILLSQSKIGKKDPFSESENLVTKLSKDFKITGFLNTKFKKYVFVIYLGNEGTISENSVGGVNTSLLPKGAKVMNIDTKANRLIINHDNEDFVFEL